MNDARLLWCLLIILLCAAPAGAQEQGDGTLHVVRPLVHAEQEEGEICLEFDHDLDAVDRHRVTSNLRLESANKNLPVASRNVSLDANRVCLSGLEHRREYRLVVTGMKGLKGEKMAGSYSLPFSIPDRQPSLTFTGDTMTGLARWQDKDPSLRVLNVPHIQLELFRITDPQAMTEAWRQRRQASLAPSESATFAHDHGQLVWSGVLDPDSTPNETLEEKIPLHEAVNNPAPGLYLIVARGPEDKKETGNLAPTSALWFLRSGLELHVFQDKNGIYALAGKIDGTDVMKDVHFVVEDSNGQQLADAKSGEDGSSYLALPEDKRKAATNLTGVAVSGDIDFVDLTQEGNFSLSTTNDASLTTDRPFYLPAAPITVALVAHDASGHALIDPNASLQLAWSDGNPYVSFPATPDKNGIADIALTAPVAYGNWLLIWRGGDGKTLAQNTLRVTSNAEAPRLEASTDRTIIPSDGGVSLTLKSLTIDGKALPYLTGHLSVAWMVPDRVFQEWRDYRFGTGERPAGDPIPLSAFMTDEKGAASLHVTLSPPEDKALLHTAILHIHGEDDEGVAEPAPLVLPIKPKEDIIGVKPLASGGQFPENGLARFSVIALDPEGHRKGMDDLAYQIYEEGRSFEWRPEEGHWGYKPLQQNRRIGGGTLTIDANRESIIEWPVTAGNYRLEITDPNGTVLTSLSFSSGWGAGEAKPNPLSLNLKSSTSVLRPGEKTDIKFNLDASSLIGAFVGDNHIRTLIHKPMTKGENTISFVPASDWGSPVTMRVEAYNESVAGQLSLLLRQDEPKPAETTAAREVAAESFSAELALPPALRISDSIHTTLALKNNSKLPLTGRLTTVPAGGIKITDMRDAAIVVAPGQSRNVSLTLNALRAGTTSLKLDVLPSHLHESREWQIPVLPDSSKAVVDGQQRIEPGQSWPTLPDKQRAKSVGGVLFLSPAPLMNAPVLLEEILETQPFTTVEISEVIEVLRVWEDPLLESGMQNKAMIDKRKEELLLRLMMRQKSDGGFPSLPGDAPDFDSTAHALIALSHADQPVSKPALDLAAGWLRHRLENTWFDEKERASRSVAYQALAEAGKLDVSSLHYFSDTSIDKSLPSLAAAQLALAFAKSGDQAKASFWLDASGVRKNQDDISFALLPVLAANSLFGSQEMASLMEKTASTIKGPTHYNIEANADLLLAVWFAQHRAGIWQVVTGTDKRTPKDVLIISQPEKGPPLVIHNTGGTPLFVSGVTHATIAAPAGPVIRHIYHLDGTEAEAHAPLEQNQTYLVILEGPRLDKKDSLIEIHDNPVFGLEPVACLPPEAIAADNLLSWLNAQNLSAQIACEIAGGGVDIVDKPDTDAWRAAYLVKTTWGGNFVLPPAQARSMEGAPEGFQSAKTRLEIR